jgi:hypothetical protein
MRVWLLQGKQGEDPGGLEPLLRQWAARPENSHWLVSVRPASADLTPDMQPPQTEVIVVAEAVCPPGAWAEELLGRGVALVVATSAPQADRFRALAETYPVHLVSAQPSAECLGLVVLGAQASLRRQLYWKNQVQNLQQRLSDRIVIERAKGILVQRLGITEEEAYKRLRVLSRRQRRQIRDIAQSLLDTQSLLLPDANGFVDPVQVEE